MSSIQTLPTSAERASALLAALRESRADLERLLSLLMPTDLALPTICSGWSVRDQVGHILDSTETLARCLEEAATGQTEGTFQPKAMAPAMQTAAINRAALLPLPQLIIEYRQLADRFLKLLEERHPEQWEAPVPHPYLGSCSAVQIPGMALVDWFIHPWDIKDALKLRPEPNPAHAALIVTGLISLMPKRLNPDQARNRKARFRYIMEKPNQPEQVLNQLDIVLANNAATIERNVSSDVPADLTFRGQPGLLALAMLGRKGLSKVVQPGPNDETWLPRWDRLWISL